MRHLIIRVPLAVIAVLWVMAASAPANSGAMLPAGAVSGDRVIWVPAAVGRIERTLEDEISDRVTRKELAQIVHSESRALRIDPLYVLAIMKVESGFRTDVVSPRGAVGLLQVRPVAARSVMRAEAVHGVEATGAIRLRDPKVNVALGLRYLQQLEKQFPDRQTVLAAYNMGPTRVRQRLAARQPVPRGYANRVLSAYRAFRADLDS